MALALVLTGCAEKTAEENFYEELRAIFPQGQVPQNLQDPQLTIEVALKQISELHKDLHRTSDLVGAGFASLEAKYDGFSFEADDPDIVINYEDEEVYRFLRPTGRAYSLWAKDVVNSINAYLAQRQVLSRPSRDTLADAFLSGMADQVDDLTSYRTPEETRRIIRLRASQDAAVAIRIEAAETGAIVRSVYDFGLLDSGLLKVGDTITAIDSKPVEGLDESGLRQHLSGPVGSDVKLEVLGADQKTPTIVVVERQEANETSLRANLVGPLLYVKIVRFSRMTAVELTDSLAEAVESEGAALQGVILDLRGNDGGLLDASVAVADVFLAEGRILSTTGRHKDSIQYFDARANAPTNRLPLVILMNGSTMSGAEIVASALQDVARAIVIGQTTRGLGAIRTVVRLPNSGELIVPWANVTTTGGYRLEKRGVLPTVCTGGVVMAKSVLATLRSGGGIIDYATRTQKIDPFDEVALKAHRALCPPRTDGEDISLEIAKAILEEPGLYERILKLDRGSQAAALP